MNPGRKPTANRERTNPRARLAQLAGAGADPDRDELLASRARALAVPAAQQIQTEKLAVVRFMTSGAAFAIESALVREAFRLRAVTPIPGAASPVLGVTVWRGAPLLLLHLGVQVEAAKEPGHFVLVLGMDTPAFGLVVEELEGAELLPVNEIREPPAATRLPSAWLRGLAHDAVVVLDGNELLRTHTRGDM